MSFKVLTDKEWCFLKNMLPEQLFRPQRGYPRADFRTVFNTIFYVLDNGCKWSDAPKGKAYATRPTAHRWLKRWSEDGTWSRLQDSVLGAVSLQKKMRHLARND